MAAVMLPCSAVGRDEPGHGTRQSLQLKALQQKGFVVRNTFIDLDVASPSAGALRRGRSAPPSTPAADAPEGDGFRLWGALISRQDASCCSPSESGKSFASSASTTYPEGESWADFSSVSGDSEADSLSLPPSRRGSVESLPGEGEEGRSRRGSAVSSPSEGEEGSAEAAAALPDLLLRECSFMRVTGHALLPSSVEANRKRGAKPCLRLFVSGLPFMRRAKWQQPLLYSVAAVLKRRGCPAFVRSGELYAPIGITTGDVVRIDFAAARQ